MVEFNSRFEHEGWTNFPGEVIVLESIATKEMALDFHGPRFYRVRVLP